MAYFTAPFTKASFSTLIRFGKIFGTRPVLSLFDQFHQIGSRTLSGPTPAATKLLFETYSVFEEKYNRLQLKHVRYIVFIPVESSF